VSDANILPALPSRGGSAINRIYLVLPVRGTASGIRGIRNIFAKRTKEQNGFNWQQPETARPARIERTIVLFFNSDCGHCEFVFPMVFDEMNRAIHPLSANPTGRIPPPRYVDRAGIVV
jgi:hypothetical protein